MTHYAPFIGKLTSFFPLVRHEIDAFQRNFCPVRLEAIHPLDPEVHGFMCLAKSQHLITPVPQLPLYPKDVDGLNPSRSIIEHIVYLMSWEHDRLLLMAVDPDGRQRLLDSLRRVEPADVGYICSVRRRRLTLSMRTLSIVSLSELSIGVLRAPGCGFDGLLSDLRSSSPLFSPLP